MTTSSDITLASNDTQTPARAAVSTGTEARSFASVMMRAVVANGYGPTDVLELAERERPVPKRDEVLVKVYATNVTAADSMMRRGDPFYARFFLGLRKPKNPVPGMGLAGVIEAVGGEVTQFEVGDPVFGEAGLGFGAHAEYVCVRAGGALMKKPESISYADAATLCDGPMTSLNFLKRMAQTQPGQKVLINGASGSLGTAAVQLAKAFGAEVTGVCSSANVELVTSLGADRVIDYTKVDFTRTEHKYDVIYDTVGKSSFRRCKRVLSKNGVYLSPVLGLGLLFSMLRTSLFGRKKAKFDATGLRPPAEQRVFLAELAEMMAVGQLRVVTECTYTLEQIAAAHAHVDGGHKKGNIVMVLVDSST